MVNIVTDREILKKSNEQEFLERSSKRDKKGAIEILGDTPKDI